MNFLQDIAQRQIEWGEANRHTKFPKKKLGWKRKALGIGLVAALVGITYSARAHNEPDFNKLPSVYKLDREIVATLGGLEIGRAGLGHGTTFKIGEHEGKHYYATAHHLTGLKIPKPKNPLAKVHDEWYIGETKLTLELYDASQDTMILSTEKDLGDEPINVCKKQPRLGENTYVYGYHRGQKAIGEGRIGDLESKVMQNGQPHYLTDADILAGASGSPHLKYEKKDFCAFGMALGNIDGGFFSASNDIKHTLALYQKVIE